MCPHEEQLTAWLLGDLSPDAQSALTRHLEGCAECRAARDELARVLGPLRSALAKDNAWRPETGMAQPPAPAPAPFWQRPHQGLRRAALLAVSFGSLFALVSAVYRNAQRERQPEAVTDIRFLKAEAPPPPLEPLPAPPESADAAENLAEASAGRVAPVTMPSAPVTPPALPAQEPHMPKLRQMISSKLDESAVPPRGPTSVSAAKAAAPKTAARRERSAATPSPRPAAGLQPKPFLLAGATAAPATAAPTNAAPTNAVAPANLKGSPQ